MFIVILQQNIKIRKEKKELSSKLRGFKKNESKIK